MRIRREGVLPGQAPHLADGELMAMEDEAGNIRLYLGTESGIPVPADGGIVTPKIYAARLDQDYLAADPGPVVIQSSLGGDIVWTRQQAGVYQGVLAGAFPEAQTALRSGDVFAEDPGADAALSTLKRIDDDTIQLTIFTVAGAASDAWYSVWISVSVFPLNV